MDQHKPVYLTANDYDAICQLWEAAGLAFKPNGRDSREAFARQLATGVQAVIGIRHQEELVGVVVATHDSRKGWINRLAVHQKYQRQGIGRRLIEACEEHFQQHDIQIIAALVETENTGSLALFRHEGYYLHDNVVYLTKREHDQV
jgi:ribosomal protein S18 acetylase RimI-like enzyme